MKSLTIIGVALAISSSVFASGFKCKSEDGINVKLFNNVNSTDGTRTPAVFVVSTEESGTLMVRRDSEIRKHNRANTVQYVTDGSDSVLANKTILQIRFKEGREVLEEGQIADAQLILISEDGDRRVTALDCTRYLKSE